MMYDLRDPAFLANPAPMLAQMRANGPLVRVRVPVIGKIWMTTSDAGARALLKSPDLFVRDMRTRGGRPIERVYWWLPPIIKPLLKTLIGADGEDHKRLRGSVDRAFARIEIEEMRAAIHDMAETLLDDVKGAEADLIAGYARPLPLMAICALLGVNPADRARVAHWIEPLSGPTSTWMILRALPGLWRLMRYFRNDFKEVRRNPRPGLISTLIEEGTLSENELLSMIVILFLAGHETTVHLIGMTLRAILDDDHLRASISQDPAKLPLLIEEILRHDSPVMLTKPMFVGEDTVFEGQPLKRGDRIMALLIAANHDPARFPTPEVRDPARRPNAHLGFGHGPHVCLGMQLARAETEIAVLRLLERFPDVQRSGPDSFVQRIGIRGLSALPVTFQPGTGQSNT